MTEHEVTSVQFTVGKLDAGMAILLSPDHHLIEFPATILPDGVATGSIVNLTIERNEEQERQQRDEFLQLEDAIFEEFSTPPQPPHIAVKHVTQTSITVQWPALAMSTAEVRGIDIYRNAMKLSIQVPPTATFCKLSGLDINQNYEIWLVVRTSAGHLTSNHIECRTHAMDNLTGLCPSFGPFTNESEVDALVDLLERVGGSYTDEFTIENTHLVCTIPRGPKYEKAVEWNIPVVSPEFLRVCEAQNKIQPAHSFYVSQ
ncbi:hypothetical protein CXG81DRAFT_9693 [Caulochytrium protostelioides]|uniref:BRCT domain-containing protein n=1 Tax=Caulochytrium protostelioides TaxID=1555241 RepID=A0A4P9XCX0_9FUNG|nr:hypothetical protein CXG81DRAFT_9693 [Caulochytrium protostelioides]|eukprot:RKP03295.1 hypothetical protein CXG81DRAFT_9693 [Caulochytrium protostelioides]